MNWYWKAKEYGEIIALREQQLDIALKELDHWKQAYCKAEQEAARLEAWATKLYKEVQELRKFKENHPEEDYEIQTDQPEV